MEKEGKKKEVVQTRNEQIQDYEHDRKLNINNKEPSFVEGRLMEY